MSKPITKAQLNCFPLSQAGGGGGNMGGGDMGGKGCFQVCFNFSSLINPLSPNSDPHPISPSNNTV